LALALQLVGIAAIAVALARSGAARWCVIVAAAGGVAALLGWTIRFRPGRLRRRGPPALDFRETLDLLRRAHSARGGWVVGSMEGPVAVADPDVGPDVLGRGEAIVQLASVDGRVHVVRDANETFAAVGDFPYGGGLLLSSRASETRIESVLAELRRFLAGMRLAEERAEGPPSQLLARRLARVAGGGQTLDAIARAGAELAQQLVERGTAIVLAAVDGGAPRVAVVSSAADPRLAGRVLDADAPAARAIATRLAVVARAGEDVFGRGEPERRRGERSGTAYPLEDGKLVVGALVVFGTPLDPDTPLLGQVGSLLAELGPRLAAAKAVHDAERRAVLDPLTGLRNRGEFQRTLQAYSAQKQPPPATLVYVDLDHFKRLNDTLGHAAGDSALKHVARVLEEAVRDGDLVARIGGEEFAVWLPRAQAREGLEVAERIRDSVAGAMWHWSGTPYPLTTSCGVAAYPEPIGDVLNLPAAADAALYRAKQGGRNRVEKANRSD